MGGLSLSVSQLAVSVSRWETPTVSTTPPIEGDALGSFTCFPNSGVAVLRWANKVPRSDANQSAA